MWGQGKRSSRRGLRATALVAVGALAAGATALGASSASAIVSGTGELSGWPKQFGTSSYDYVSALASTTAGDVYVAGSTDGTLAAGGGGLTDGFVQKFDKYGKQVWTIQFGSDQHELVVDIAVRGNELYVLGSSNGDVGAGYNASNGYDVFVKRFALDGANPPTLTWSTMFGTGSDEFPTGLALAGSDLYVTGNTPGDLSGSAVALHGFDGFVAHLRTDGTHPDPWIDQWSTTEVEGSLSVAVLGGDVYVGGYTSGIMQDGAALDADGDAVVARYSRALVRKTIVQFGSTAFDAVTDVAALGSDIYLAGNTAGVLAAGGGGAADVFLARYDKKLAQKSVVQFGSTDRDGIKTAHTKVAVSRSAVFVTSSTDGSIDGFAGQGNADGILARFTRAGAKTWVRQFGTTQSDTPTALALRPNDDYGGAVVVAGMTDGTVWGQVKYGSEDPDAFVASFPSSQGGDTSPAVGWPYEFGTNLSDEGLGLAYAPNGDTIVGGHTGGSISPIPSEAHQSGWGYDCFVAAIDKQGRRRWVHQFGSIEDEYVTSVAAARNGDVYVGGRSYGKLPGFKTENSGAYDGFIRKYDKNGRLKWTYQIHGIDPNKGDYVNGLAVARNGDVYAVGYTEGGIARANADSYDDGFIIKLGSNGRRRWIREFEPAVGPGTVWVLGVAVAANGDPYIVGNVDAQLATDDYNGRADAFIARYNASGARLWVHQVGASDHDSFNSITIAPDGSVYAGGETQSVINVADVDTSNPYSDVFIARYDKNGARAWLRQIGQRFVYENDIAAVAATNDAVYLASTTQGQYGPFTSQGTDTTFVTKLAPATGNSVWVRQYGAVDSRTYLKGMAIAPSDKNGGGLILLSNIYGGGSAWGQSETVVGSVSVTRFPR